MEQLAERKCVGWQEGETARLFSAVQEAQSQGAPLRRVFETLSTDLHRKPNSIRNYYYACLRQERAAENDADKSQPHPPCVQRFVPFTEQETHDLVRQVLIGRGEGKSVRACVMQLANGDHRRMLRYQNKYRAVVRHQPQLVAAVGDELAKEGLTQPTAEASPTASVLPSARPLNGERSLREERPLREEQAHPPVQAVQQGIRLILGGVQELAHQAALGEHAQKQQRTIDQMRVEHDLLRIAWEKDYRAALGQLQALADCGRQLSHLPDLPETARCALLDQLSQTEQFFAALPEDFIPSEREASAP